MAIDHEDLLLLCLVIDDCSRLHVEWSNRISHANSRAELKEVIAALQTEIEARKAKGKK